MVVEVKNLLNEGFILNIPDFLMRRVKSERGSKSGSSQLHLSLKIIVMRREL
jgi:hypothetical protein